MELNVMTKEQFTEKLNAMILKSMSSKSSGFNGSIFEAFIHGSNNDFSTLVSEQGAECDCIITLNGITYKSEEKSGCGELAKRDSFGNLSSALLEADIVLYTMEFEPVRILEFSNSNNLDIIEAFKYMLKHNMLKYPVYAVKPETFIKLVGEVGLLRDKTSTEMSKQPAPLQYYDRVTIQSFKNSKRKMIAFANALETYGMKVTEFK